MSNFPPTVPALSDEFVSAFLDICTERRQMGDLPEQITQQLALAQIEHALNQAKAVLSAAEALGKHEDLRPYVVKIAAAATSIVEIWS